MNPDYESREFEYTTREAYSEVATIGILSKKMFLKFRKIHRKTPVPESLLLKKCLRHRCLPVNFAKFL